MDYILESGTANITAPKIQYWIVVGQSTTNSLSPISSALGRVESYGIHLIERSTIEDYLLQHPDMLAKAISVCQIASEEFGSEAGLYLAVYIDPEIDDSYLTLYIRWKNYGADILDEIERISEKCFPFLKGVSGRILITTDFQPLE